MKRDDFTAALLALLEDPAVRPNDPGANGIQIAGKEEISRVATGTTMSVSFLRGALAIGAGAVVTHHGLWFPAGGATLGQPLQQRLRLIFQHDLSAYGFHYLLDAHREVGNAAELARMLGASLVEPFGVIDGRPWGWSARFETPREVGEIAAMLEARRGSPLPSLSPFGPREVSRCAIVTGSGSRTLAEAATRQLELLVVGDVTEQTQEEARELGVSVIAAGHAFTETFGPKALARWINEHLPVKAEFVDVPNPT